MIQIDHSAQVSLATSRMFSTNLPCIKLCHDDEWHVASPLPKGCSRRASNFHTPFRHDISSNHITTMYGSSDHIRRKMLMVPDHIHDQKIVKEERLPKHKVDDEASSKTHLGRFMHNVVTSEFKIFSVAKPDVGIPDSVQRLLRSFQY